MCNSYRGPSHIHSHRKSRCLFFWIRLHKTLLDNQQPESTILKPTHLTTWLDDEQRCGDRVRTSISYIIVLDRNLLRTKHSFIVWLCVRCGIGFHCFTLLCFVNPSVLTVTLFFRPSKRNKLTNYTHTSEQTKPNQNRQI